jgi:DNA gyrase subunit A
MGRSTQGVRVMNIKEDDRVSAVALVVDSESEQGTESGDEASGQEQLEEASGGDGVE